jgi:hypothetical protein
MKVTIDRAVLEQALEALESKYIVNCGAWRVQQDQVITTLRQALEAAYHHPVSPELEAEINKAIVEPVQAEPVAWQGVHDKTDLYYRKPAQADVRPLYPAPQRTWVGLTDEEITDAEYLAAVRYKKHMGSIRGQQITPADDPQWHFARAIEAKLKEKNNG